MTAADTPAYHLDLSLVSIEEFFDTLRAGELSPGRIALVEDKPNRLQTIRTAGVATLADLVDRLKTKPRLAAFGAATGLSDDYLVLLRRQALSWLPNPVPLSRFLGVPESLVEALRDRGINQGRQLVEAAKNEAERTALAAATHASEEALLDLVKMANLTRINGIGPTFARLLVSMEIEGLAHLSRLDPAEHAMDVQAHLVADGYTGPPVTDWDVKTYIASAARLAKMVDFDR